MLARPIAMLALLASTAFALPTNTPVHALQASPQPESHGFYHSPYAWFRAGTDVDLETHEWHDVSGNGHNAVLTGEGFEVTYAPGHGSLIDVSALQGTTASKIDFGPVIDHTFTICSVTRWTSSDPHKQQRVLAAWGGNWLHGHHHRGTGVAYYAPKWKTVDTYHVQPKTNWVMMCGTNSGTNLQLVFGVDMSNGNVGGRGHVKLQVLLLN